ncbi:MAG: hypothetical protein IJF31_03705 [Clostridia bacterium]|nr:hypothetical protein [Clostridia bacterium]
MHILSMLKNALQPKEPDDELQNEKHALYLVYYENVAYEQFQNCLEALKSFGAALFASRRINDNYYTTHTVADTAIHLCYYQSCRELRICVGRYTYLPSQAEKKGSALTVPTLTQIGLTVEGASHAVQLADGSFFMLDGGIASDQEVERLFLFLKSRTPSHEKPRIAAWVISHAHNDHIHLCQEFLKRYHSEIVLEVFGYNFPDYDTDLIKAKGTSPHWQAQMNEILDTYFKAAKRWTPHSGEVLVLPGGRIEVLCTWEDFWPLPFGNINQTSLCLRLHFDSGKIALLPTDAWREQTAKMAALFGKELKCDVLQAAHHGLAGGSISFYECAAPEIVLWNTPHWRFAAEQDLIVAGREKPIKVTRSFEPSRYLIANAGRHYTHEKTVTLNMNDLSEV